MVGNPLFKMLDNALAPVMQQFGPVIENIMKQFVEQKALLQSIENRLVQLELLCIEIRRKDNAVPTFLNYKAPEPSAVILSIPKST